ncbi:MAG: response regulator transcription factor [Bacteroidetes bacterium]|nr:response regulator transcription factor [Bacteroidota bacterium]MBL6943366.1 response regulator transcription factor [Bacteroidales bacterium]
MLNPLTAIIVDDEKAARNGLESLINSNISNVEVIAKAENAQNALEIIIDKHPDLIFLDIQMPVNNGFWLAGKLNKLKTETCIIFVTAYDEYAVKAIKYAAFDFLMKPVIPETLKEAVDRFVANKDKCNLNKKLETLKIFLNQDKIKFNIYNGFVMISPDNIIYCEAEKNYCNIYLSNGKKEFITSKLEVLEEELKERSFVKISRSAIINIDYLESFDRKTKTVALSDVLQKYELKVSSSGIKRLSAL